jgi:hypothetical protein
MKKDKKLFDEIVDFMITERCYEILHVKDCYRLLESKFEITNHNKHIFLSALVLVGYSLKAILKFIGESYTISFEFMEENK